MSSFGPLNANRSELSEYVSLLRALRTNELLGIASQAATTITAPPVLSDSDDEGTTDPVFVDELAPTHSPSSSQPLHTHTHLQIPIKTSLDDSDTGSANAYPKRARVPADEEVWTRWPLKLDQLHASKWDLVEEVHQIMAHVLSPDHPMQADTVVDTKHPLRDDGPLQDDNTKEDTHTHHDTCLATVMAISSTHYIEHIFGALAAFVPDPSSSLRGRVKAMEWESVLTIVGTCGIASSQTVDIVRRRMEAMLDEESTTHQLPFTGGRLFEHQEADRPKYNNALDFLSIPEGLESAPSKKRKYTFVKRQPRDSERKKKKKRPPISDA